MGFESVSGALRAEIVFRNQTLSRWIKTIQAGGGMETLFEMEAWLKGISCFLDIRHLPLSEGERAQLISRNFAPEIQIVRRALQIGETCASKLARLAGENEFTMEAFIKAQVRRERFLSHPATGGMAEISPAESLAKLLDGCNDLRVLTEIGLEGARQNLQAYRSLQRSYGRMLRNCEYISLLLGQKFRPEYDIVDNPRLSTAIRAIPENGLRRKVALTLLHFYRGLKYLELVVRELRRDLPLRHFLVIYALIHEEMGNLADYMKSSFRKSGHAGAELVAVSEMIVCSLTMEAEHLIRRELILVSRDPDASSVFSKVESGHGMLRNCFENCIITLVQALDSRLNPAMLFPRRTDGFRVAQRLRQDLWELRQHFKQILEAQQMPESSRIIERLALLRDTSMSDLMHCDHMEFERFADALVTSGSPLEARSHLRKFVGYLEALTQEISKRSVLREAANPEVAVERRA